MKVNFCLGSGVVNAKYKTCEVLHELKWVLLLLLSVEKMAFHYFFKKIPHNHKDDLIKCYDLLSLLDATEKLHANIVWKYRYSYYEIMTWWEFSMDNEQKAGFMCSMIVLTMNIYFEPLFITIVYNSSPSLCGEHRPVFCMVIFFTL